MSLADGAGERRFGVFFLASMQLGLPLEALREVVPRGALAALPCAAPCVVGGVDLRGTLVPVVDLRRVIGMDPAAGEADSIVIMAHEGRLLGLLASGVVGVFTCEAGGWSRLEARNAALPLFDGGFRRPDDGVLVSVLSPEGLAGLQDVPMVDCPGSARGLSLNPAATGTGGAAEAYLMLVRTGPVPMALASDAVYTTILHPQILNSPLAGGWCLGIIEYAGVRIPAVDLLAFCGLGEIANPWLTQAFLVQYPRGWVAFMVDEIIDVLRTGSCVPVPIPAGTLPRDGLFAGALPMAVLTCGAVSDAGRQTAYSLLLDAQQIRANPELQGLGRVNTPVDGAAAGTAGGPDDEAQLAGTRCQVLTYDLGFEVATPIEQITEILPWSDDCTLFGAGSRTTGLVVSGGRAIPTFCLSTLMGLPGAERSPTASVLVVDTGGGFVGFNVPRLLSIDDAPRSRPEASGVARANLQALPEAAGVRWSPLRVGSGSAERMLGVLDLKHLAASLCGQAEPA
ncbi:chemotaxis protein CheW [Zoogloea dura]|uniref:Chemotaxis protein CheW n=1 Tax=Zoogloea dura TaxID=2728840 RepID=A0A848GAV8_9RHOO|nr:chemotaxis protein CheW [Zoogloea dura]NML28444.1 chemotaxis protein CheW [Zoogloea dura]